MGREGTRVTIFVQMLYSIFLFVIIGTVENRLVRLAVRALLVFMSFQLMVWLITDGAMNEFGWKTWFLMNANMLFFCLGSLSCRDRTARVIAPPRYGRPPPFTKRTLNWLIFIGVIELVVLTYYIRKQSLLLLAFGGQSARELYFGMKSESLFGSYGEYLIFFVFVKSYLYLASFQFATVFFSEGKNLRAYFLLLISLVAVGISSLIGQGRSDVLVFVYILIGYAICLAARNALRRHDLIAGVFLFAAAFVFMVIITILRMNLDPTMQNVSANFVEASNPFMEYFSFPLTAFKLRADEMSATTGFLFGRATFAGLQELIITPLLYVDGSIASLLTNSTIGELTTPFVFIHGRTWNALYTGMLTYYLDFGVLGFVFFPLLYGKAIRVVAIRASKNGTVLSVFLFSYIFQSVLKNQISSSPQAMGFWIVLAIVLMLKIVSTNAFLVDYAIGRLSRQLTGGSSNALGSN